MTQHSNQNSQTNGRWTKEEHEKFLVGLQMFGKNWKKIEGVIGTRTGSQIRSHAQKFFLKVKKTLENDPQQDLNSNQTPSVLSNSTCQIDKSSEHSYFFNQIVKRSQTAQSFDFWQSLIDHSNNCGAQIETREIKRKSSFVLFEDEQQENSIISLNEAPRKRIKM